MTRHTLRRVVCGPECAAHAHGIPAALCDTEVPAERERARRISEDEEAERPEEGERMEDDRVAVWERRAKQAMAYAAGNACPVCDALPTDIGDNGHEEWCCGKCGEQWAASMYVARAADLRRQARDARKEAKR